MKLKRRAGSHRGVGSRGGVCTPLRNRVTYFLGKSLALRVGNRGTTWVPSGSRRMQHLLGGKKEGDQFLSVTT
jgi:hypothetical protein